jgi:glycosyltransferase involved in cell wall biosynthesis
MPPQRTGIADYSLALLPYLAGEFDSVDLYTREASAAPASIETFSVDRLPARWSDYDFCLYHIGNVKAFHEDVYRLALAYPGVVVLHDFFLHHLVSGLTLGRGDLPAYVREMAYSEGGAGVERAYRAAHDWDEMPLFEIPLSDRLLDVSLGTIVHSRYALDQALSRRPRLRAAYIPAPVGPETPDRLSRTDLGLPEEAFIVTVAGMPNAAKRMDLVLRAVEALSGDLPGLRCLLVGELLEGVQVPHGLALSEELISIGYVPSLTRFLAFMQASDVIVNLRSPTVGEASALTLRALALGKAVIVSNAGWYADLPDGGCMKLIHTGDPEVDGRILADYLRRLECDREMRARIGALGQTYVRNNHHSSQVARAYRTVMNDWRTMLYG